MNYDLQRYYEARSEMMATEGWRDLMQDVKRMLDATDKVSILKTSDDMHFRKGEISIMQWLLALQDMSEVAYKELQENG